MAKTIRRWVPMPVTLDGETITLEVKRLTRTEFLEFEERWREFNKPAEGAEDLVKEFAGDAQKVAEALAEREKELEPEERARREAAREDRKMRLVVWTEQVVRDYCRAPAGVLDLDGEAVETGAEIVAALDSDFTFMFSAVSQVWFANILTSEQRKNFELLFGSSTTSDEQLPAADGPRPEPTADGADSSVSAVSDGATPVEAAPEMEETPTAPV